MTAAGRSESSRSRLSRQGDPDAARGARALGGVDQAGAKNRLVEVALGGAPGRGEKVRDDSAEPVGMMRPFRQGRQPPTPLPRARFENQSVAGDANLALLSLDFDRVRALIRGPGQKDAAQPRRRIQLKRRGVLERLLMEAARFEPRRDASGNAGPAHDAIER